MSDLCLYEGRGVWTGFRESTEDHIVPRRPRWHRKRFTFGGDEELEEEPSQPNLKKRKSSMLKGGCSCLSSHNEECEAPDFFKSMISSTIQGGDFPCGNSIVNDICSSAGNNVYDFPLTEGNAGGFSCDDIRGSENPLYYRWSDINGFNEADRMFRSCYSSSFGLENMDSNELCWFSHPNPEGDNFKDTTPNDGHDDFITTSSSSDEFNETQDASVSEEQEERKVIDVSEPVKNVEEGVNDRNGHEINDGEDRAKKWDYNSDVVDDVSIVGVRFHQLQAVMEKLDADTRLHVRDSLYRLAQSAEKRRHAGEPSDEPNRCCLELNEMEVNTNPLDRSLAHLLFHCPLTSLASHAML